MVKVLISYDMQEGKEQECQEYLANKMAPTLAGLGFRVSDVWYTVWGSSPQILGGGELNTLSEAQRIFGSDEWREIAANMAAMTNNFKVRIVQGGS